MNFIDEYRDAATVRRLAAEIARVVTRPWSIMEICGGQTHAILRFGLEQLLPAGVELIHGPGCPVCVTPAAVIDQAVDLARERGVILCTFGDMLRVPGARSDLMEARARGAAVRVVYSPLDAVTLARATPDREVVFLAVGFETTAPANALALLRASALGLRNFSLLTSQVMVPPAIAALLSDPAHRIQGFLAAGHVCTVTGTADYGPLAERFGLPIVVTGFEPVDILAGLLACLRRLEAGQGGVENAYTRAVRPEGNAPARAALEKIFMPVDKEWRGLGRIPRSGLSPRPEYAAFDAEKKFGLAPAADAPDAAGECLAGLVLQGRLKPTACPAFGTRCTPEHPLGATMVSNEGACAAYYRYRQPASA